MLLTGNSSYAFSFYLTVSPKFIETEKVIYCGLEGVFYVGASLCRLCDSNIFGENAIIYGMDASHVFPQSVLATIPLIEDVIGVVHP